MKSVSLENIAVGTELPALLAPPITRQTLAIYCGASGDHNPVHVDLDYAKAAGLEDVIAHGMLVMAYTGRVLTDWVPHEWVTSFNTRFLAMTRVGEVITASGTIVEKIEDGGTVTLRVALEAANEHGEKKVSGEATVQEKNIS